MWNIFFKCLPALRLQDFSCCSYLSLMISSDEPQVPDVLRLQKDPGGPANKVLCKIFLAFKGCPRFLSNQITDIYDCLARDKLQWTKNLRN